MYEIGSGKSNKLNNRIQLFPYIYQEKGMFYLNRLNNRLNFTDEFHSYTDFTDRFRSSISYHRYDFTDRFHTSFSFPCDDFTGQFHS